MSAKIKEIDDQHKILIGLINLLHDAMLANRGSEIQKEIVTELAEYVRYHFATEEKYMRLFVNPQAAGFTLSFKPRIIGRLGKIWLQWKRLWSADGKVGAFLSIRIDYNHLEALH